MSLRDRASQPILAKPFFQQQHMVGTVKVVEPLFVIFVFLHVALKRCCVPHSTQMLDRLAEVAVFVRPRLSFVEGHL